MVETIPYTTDALQHISGIRYATDIRMMDGHRINDSMLQEAQESDTRSHAAGSAGAGCTIACCRKREKQVSESKVIEE
ncbi:hypothetical protein G8C92_26655 [Paenibacillus donghaensis]|uniref:hypothetical protein n=1 Tax=Paenibacillus donghaensis TaxID=414771 RepID=UPI001884199D|nr:hypothetical protein [Paenibacillus donghaensis]MBE9917601.1 hypothetical protein [Paenibacillus donghaensis]